jgi:TPR repeat protein
MFVTECVPESPENLYDIGAGHEKHGRGILAFTYYSLAADAGHEGALYKVRCVKVLGTFMPHEAAIQKLTCDALDGDANAQCRLAFCYDFGIGVVSDLATALCFFGMAAEQDNPGAVFELGRYCEYGLGGMEQDMRLALGFYKRAARLGYRPAQIRLASIEVPSPANSSPSPSPSHLTSGGKDSVIEN